MGKGSKVHSTSNHRLFKIIAIYLMNSNVIFNKYLFIRLLQNNISTYKRFSKEK